jgi:hypothetical protein
MRCHNFRFAVAVEIAGSHERRVVPRCPTKRLKIVRPIHCGNERPITIAQEQSDRVIVQPGDGDVRFAVGIEVHRDHALGSFPNAIRRGLGETATPIALQDDNLIITEMADGEINFTATKIRSNHRVSAVTVIDLGGDSRFKCAVAIAKQNRQLRVLACVIRSKEIAGIEHRQIHFSIVIEIPRNDTVGISAHVVSHRRGESDVAGRALINQH